MNRPVTRIDDTRGPCGPREAPVATGRDRLGSDAVACADGTRLDLPGLR